MPLKHLSNNYALHPAGSGQKQVQNGLHPHGSPADGDSAVTVLATEQPNAGTVLLAAAQTQTAPVVKAASSMTSKVSQGARILLRGRDEDLGIDAIGNMARFRPPPMLPFTQCTNGVQCRA